MHDVSAIVLAGGLSQRMGAVNKLLLPIDGVPMIRRCVQAYLAVCTGEVRVVTGHQHAQVRTALNGLEVAFTHNPVFANGQKTSVAAGVAAAARSDALFVALGDQPFLTPDNLAALLDAHFSAGGERISLPERNGKRGNPLVIPDQLRARLLEDRQNPGCHRFTRNNPHLVNCVATRRQAFFHDIDTPEGFHALTSETEDVT